MCVNMTVGRLIELLQEYPEHQLVDFQLEAGDPTDPYEPRPVTDVVPATSINGAGGVVIR